MNDGPDIIWVQQIGLSEFEVFNLTVYETNTVGVLYSETTWHVTGYHQKEGRNREHSKCLQMVREMVPGPMDVAG